MTANKGIKVHDLNTSYAYFTLYTNYGHDPQDTVTWVLRCVSVNRWKTGIQWIFLIMKNKRLSSTAATITKY